MRPNWTRAATLLTLMLGAMCFSTSALAVTDPPAVVQAKKQLADAQSELTKANVALSAIAQKVVKDMEATPEWKQATVSLHEATVHHNNAVKSVRDKVRSQPDYQAALAERNRRQQERDALRAGTNPDPDKLARAAADLLNASAVVNHMETNAMTSDERVAKTQTELDEAKARFDALRKTLPDLAKKDPAYEPAHQRAEQAAAKVNDAGKQLSLAKQQQDQADSQRMNSDIEGRRDQMKRMSPFGR